MGIFKRIFKRKGQPKPFEPSPIKPLTGDLDLASRIDAMRPAASPKNARVASPKECRPESQNSARPPGIAGIFKGIDIGSIVKSITQVMRDPNGKISSKRAGAGALVTAGIALLMKDPPAIAAGVVLLTFALGLFALTKFDEFKEPEQ